MFWSYFLFVFLVFATLCLGFLFILLIKEVLDEISYSHDAWEWLAMFSLPFLTLFALIACIAGCIDVIM